METKTMTLKSGEVIEARQITASFPGKCPACGGAIKPGEAIWYHKRIYARHVNCPPPTAQVSTPQAQVQTQATHDEIRRNRRPDYCRRCGHMVPAGEGSLVHLEDEEDIDFIGKGQTWIVYHGDKVLCDKYIADDKREKQEKETQEAALKVEREELAAKVAATGVEQHDDWSWDDYRFSLGDTIAESEHYVARQYFDSYPGPDKVLLGFVIKAKKGV